MWTLFEEHNLHWSPHARLSTWLSLAAIVVMLPAVVVYNKALVSIVIHIFLQQFPYHLSFFPPSILMVLLHLCLLCCYVEESLSRHRLSS